MFLCKPPSLPSLVFTRLLRWTFDEDETCKTPTTEITNYWEVNLPTPGKAVCSLVQVRRITLPPSASINVYPHMPKSLPTILDQGAWSRSFFSFDHPRLHRLGVSMRSLIGVC